MTDEERALAAVKAANRVTEIVSPGLDGLQASIEDAKEKAVTFPAHFKLRRGKPLICASCTPSPWSSPPG